MGDMFPRLSSKVAFLPICLMGCGDQLKSPAPIPEPLPVAVERSGPGPSDSSEIAYDFAPIRIGNEWVYKRTRSVMDLQVGTWKLASEVRIAVDSIFRIGESWKSYMTMAEKGVSVVRPPWASEPDTVWIDTIFQFVLLENGNGFSGYPGPCRFFFRHRFPTRDTVVRTWKPLDSYAIGDLPGEYEGAGVVRLDPENRYRLVHLWEKHGYSGGGATFHILEEHWYDQDIGLVRATTRSDTVSLERFNASATTPQGNGNKLDAEADAPYRDNSAP